MTDTQEQFTIPPENTDVQFYFGGSPATNQPPEGGVVSGHNKKNPPFSGHTGTTEPHLFFSHLAPLQYPLLYTFFSRRLWHGR